MKLFSIDNPFMVGLRKLTDHMFLGLLWVLVSLPVITFGAATAAMFYTAEKAIAKDEGRILHTFWKVFRKDFRQATVLWLLEILILAVVLLDIRLLLAVELPGYLRVLLIIAVIFVLSWLQLWFGYLSKFEDNSKVLLSNTLRMTVGNFLKVFLLSALAVAALAGAYILILMPPLLVLIPGTYQILARKLFRSVFSRYITGDENDLIPDE